MTSDPQGHAPSHHGPPPKLAAARTSALALLACLAIATALLLYSPEVLFADGTLSDTPFSTRMTWS